MVETVCSGSNVDGSVAWGWSWEIEANDGSFWLEWTTVLVLAVETGCDFSKCYILVHFQTTLPSIIKKQSSMRMLEIISNDLVGRWPSIMMKQFWWHLWMVITIPLILFDTVDEILVTEVSNCFCFSYYQHIHVECLWARFQGVPNLKYSFPNKCQ